MSLFNSHSYTDPQNHQFLIEFLKKTGQFYAVAYTPFDFLVDLLAIEVPQLFAHEQSDSDHYSEFSTFLQDYVSGGHIEEKLPLILVSYCTLIHICFMYTSVSSSLKGKYNKSYGACKVYSVKLNQCSLSTW